MTTPDPARLSRERVLQVALALVERDGLDALSMRRIAQELDVWPMGLYRHFRDKDELIAALGDAAAGAVSLPLAAAPWRAQLADLLGQLQPALARHGTLDVDGPRHTPAAHRVSETGLAILGGAGFDAAEAVQAWQALLSYTAGYPGLAPPTARDEFTYGLERMLDGLEARLEAAGG